MRRSAMDRRAFVDARAGAMAANMTPAERKLWTVLEPMGFQPQWVWSGETKNGGRWDYVTDFYLPSAALAVEVDGSVHDKRRGRDRRRTTRLAVEYGIKVIRFTNREVLRDPNGIGWKIQFEIEERRG